VCVSVYFCKCLDSKNFQKVRWLLTSLDAATLSTLKVKFGPLRHALTLLLSGYYLFNFRRAENQVEAFRRSCTHHAIRACWEKGSTPVLAAVDKITRKRCSIELELVPIRSPDGHEIECRLFYNKSRDELAKETSVLLDFPGGGFIAMSPQHHADYLSFWAMALGIPVLSVNYRKAPEFPFPCGFEDAWVSPYSLSDTRLQQF
jgi:acetyl esterase/lipase